ncbi:large-conductance mechanosensitive channel protein MscL [Christensenella sp. MSJ-20]|uniref:large-conductance mechanosensitive channel protein MscL n=1 Tax=Christensenella sp. MSJ-20 TaxID=2841518 RepID=UPI000D78FB73|nr:MAG: large conductance mechanosensitive channel protein MscL [Bacillota bacterium]
MIMWQEFKKFAMKGNVMDMAIGVVIGGAFGKIVTSLVGDIIMPILGTLTAGADFTSLKLVLSPAVVENGQVITPESAIAYGAFLQNVLDFFIIAFSIFLCIKLINKAHDRLVKKNAEEEAPAPAGPTTEELLTEIRDYLKELDQK